jgi:hypothetical protein
MSGKFKPLQSYPAAVWSWFRKDFIWPLLLLPILYALLLYFIFDLKLMGEMVGKEWKTWDVDNRWKDVFEIVHPSLLTLGAFLGFLGAVEYKKRVFAFLGLLCGFALFRELAGQGWTVVLYIGILLSIIYARYNSEKLILLHESRWTLSFVGMCFSCYALSQLMDRGLVKRLARPFTETKWPPYSSAIEEGLESLGGFFLLLAIISLFFLKGKPPFHSSPIPSTEPPSSPPQKQIPSSRSHEGEDIEKE